MFLPKCRKWNCPNSQGLMLYRSELGPMTRRRGHQLLLFWMQRLSGVTFSAQDQLPAPSLSVHDGAALPSELQVFHLPRTWSMCTMKSCQISPIHCWGIFDLHSLDAMLCVGPQKTKQCICSGLKRPKRPRHAAEMWTNFAGSKGSAPEEVPAFFHKSFVNVSPGMHATGCGVGYTLSSPPRTFATLMPCQVTLRQTHRLPILLCKFAAWKRNAWLLSRFYHRALVEMVILFGVALQPKWRRLHHVSFQYQIQVSDSPAPKARTISAAPPFPPCPHFLWTQKWTHRSNPFPVSATCALHPVVKASNILYL